MLIHCYNAIKVVLCIILIVIGGPLRGIPRTPAMATDKLSASDDDDIAPSVLLLRECDRRHILPVYGDMKTSDWYCCLLRFRFTIDGVFGVQICFLTVINAL